MTAAGAALHPDPIDPDRRWGGLRDGAPPGAFGDGGGDAGAAASRSSLARHRARGAGAWVNQMGLMPRSPCAGALREGVSAARALMAGETVSREGRVFSFDAVKLVPPGTATAADLHGRRRTEDTPPCAVRSPTAPRSRCWPRRPTSAGCAGTESLRGRSRRVGPTTTGSRRLRCTGSTATRPPRKLSYVRSPRSTPPRCCAQRSPTSTGSPTSCGRCQSAAAPTRRR